MADWRVLVVEDDLYSRQVVWHMLSYQGIQVDLAQDGAEALRLLGHERYDMAIIDLSMPGMDGWRLLQNIHANPTLAEMSCVAVTAYHDSRVEQEVYKAGFKAYFPKPLTVAFPEQIENLLMQ